MVKKEENVVIAQEWLVRFDGEIKRTEKKIYDNRNEEKKDNDV